MNYFKRYIEYIKDNPKGYWFKRKLYGWGWEPATWQGWLVIAIFILFVLWNGTNFGTNQEPTEAELKWFFVKLISAVVVLLAICFKTGESPKWQWGFPKNNQSKENPE